MWKTDRFADSEPRGRDFNKSTKTPEERDELLHWSAFDTTTKHQTQAAYEGNAFI